MSQNTLIVFDIDGTLTQTAKMHQAAFNRTLAHLGVAEHGLDLNAFIHHTDSYISKEIYEQKTGKSFDTELKVRFEELLSQDIGQKEILEVEGAVAFVKRLHNETSIDFCFATGSLRRPAIYKLKELEIPYEDEILVASDEHYSREAIITTAISQAKTYYQKSSYDRIISFGDGIWDLKAAQKLRLKFVGIGEKNKEVMLEAGMIHHFQDFTSADKIMELTNRL